MSFASSKFLKILLFILIPMVFLGLFFLDRGLAIGLIFLSFLVVTTFLILSKIGIGDKKLKLLFLIALFIHLGAVMFIYYAHFQPFGGGSGDYISYHRQAQEIAERVRQANFSLQGLNIAHFYPVVIGYIYVLTLPEMIIGQLFGVWLAAISILLTYLIVLEIGGSRIWAFLIGLIVAIYPSYLFYGSLLLKDTLVVPLALVGLLLTLKLIKNFSWKNFLIFYIVLVGLIHFRFYIGYVLLFTFIFCWLILSKLNLRKRLIYALIIIPILGFSPQISGYGYYGINTIKQYLHPQTVTFYREVAYVRMDSSIVIETGFENPLKFLGNTLKSFVYVLLGPFPWQMKYPRHFLALFETIPWYFLLFFIIKGALGFIKRDRIALPLIIFSFGALAVLALFLSNFGILTRIRIPAFISLLCLLSLSFNLENRYIKNLPKIFNKLWQNI